MPRALFSGHVFVYVNGSVTGGVPDANADIRLVIDPNNQQTEMAVYTIPAGKTGYLRSGYAATSGSNKSSNYIIKLYIREFGKVFRVQHTVALADNGTSLYQHIYVEPSKILEKTDIIVTAEATGTGVTGAAISAGFDIVLVDN